MQPVQCKSQILWGINRKPFGRFLLLYLFFICFYATICSINEINHVKYSFLESLTNWLFICFIDYAIKFIITIPVWYIVFVACKKWQLWKRLSLHIGLIVCFVIAWMFIFYTTMEFLGYYHLEGYAQVWDIYIPALFYMIQLGVLHTHEYYTDSQKRLQTEAELREAVLSSELSALKAQLNPHFLYNIFNTISASLPPEQEETREMIAELADLFRYQLKASRSELVPLYEEMDFINKYLALEKARFGERLQIKLDIHPGLLNHKIPPMILQPLVENAIKHGLASQIEGGEIAISIQNHISHLHFEIADTGVGIKDKTLLLTNGVGLQNTRLRLEKMYNTQLHFADNYPSGLKISFDIEISKTL